MTDQSKFASDCVTAAPQIKLLLILNLLIFLLYNTTLPLLCGKKSVKDTAKIPFLDTPLVEVFLLFLLILVVHLV